MRTTGWKQVILATKSPGHKRKATRLREPGLNRIKSSSRRRGSERGTPRGMTGRASFQTCRPNRENPDLIRTYILANDGAGTYVYPNFSPYGVNGGYYYARANFRF